VKQLLLLIALALPLACAAQQSADALKLPDGTQLPLDADTHLITYQGVVETPGATKDQLYTRAYDWMLRTFRTSNNVVQKKDAGQVVGSGAWPIILFHQDAGQVVHTLTVYVKDGRYKYVLSNLTHQSEGADAMKGFRSGGPLEQTDVRLNPMFFGNKQWNNVRQQANTEAKKLLVSLQSAMNGAKDPSDF
jgi:hypothetical protein